jgi:hypothetical protein
MNQTISTYKNQKINGNEVPSYLVKQKPLLKKTFVLLFLVAFLSQIGSSQNGIIVDRHSVQLFDSIPLYYKNAAADLHMFFMNRSVGGQIDDGLSCLSVPWSTAPNHCKRHNHTGVPSFSVDPGEVYWDDTWDRSNWIYEFWPTTTNCEWMQAVDCFVNSVDTLLPDLDVLGFQFSYLAVDNGSTIADSLLGFFGNMSDRGTADDLLLFAANNPTKTVIWFTSSLARAIGTPESESFNNLMRQFAIANNLVLFDVADILSHTPTGLPCYDNRDGQQYCF